MSKFFHLIKKPCQTTESAGINNYNCKKTIIVFVVMIIAVSVLYLAQANGMATKGYKMKELEQKILQMKISSKGLESKILELQSIKNISSKINKLDMVSGGTVKYLAATPDIMAIAR